MAPTRVIPALVLLAAAGGAGFAVSTRHPARIRPTSPRSTAVLCSPADAAEEPAPSPRLFSRAWFSKWAKFDKDTLKTLGVDAFFTYGVVSNLNAGITIALAWGVFSQGSGMSPLAPGPWKGFLSTYTAIYLSLGTILRPVRMALAVSLTPLYGRGVAALRASLPFRETRPKLNRTIALVLISLVFNTMGTCAVIALGAWLAGLVTGVPAFPPGYTFTWPGRGASA